LSRSRALARVSALLVFSVLVIASAVPCGAQQFVSQPTQIPCGAQQFVSQSTHATRWSQDDRPKFPHLGVGLKMSTLGTGIELATPVTQRTNFRLGFNNFGYAHAFNYDGSRYSAQLKLFSLQANYDWFPFGNSFHLSPGLLYNGNRVKANTSDTAASQAEPGVFTNPITGSARIGFSKFSPMFLMGWGNLIPRSGRHFSIPFEFGAAYHGQPKASLQMNPIICPAGDFMCIMASADPSIQSSFQAEQVKIRQEVSRFKIYPVISIGLGYRF
jgi:hypothetical protein